jgi:hypothetical protein
MFSVNPSHARHQAMLMDFVIKTLRINSRALLLVHADFGLLESFVTRDVTRTC